jgi:hypothetical protein
LPEALGKLAWNPYDAAVDVDGDLRLTAEECEERS